MRTVKEPEDCSIQRVQKIGSKGWAVLEKMAKRPPKPTKALIALLAGVALTACQTPAPVDRPCGVIIDSLRDVIGKTPADTRRIDVHFERGIAAGCWGRKP